MNLTPNRRMAVIAFSVLVLDQLTKMMVIRWLRYAEEFVVIDGFFKLVHWGNTGAAWSLFNKMHGSNQLLAIVSLVALLVLFLYRNHFDIQTSWGQTALGLMFGGIIGNLIDRMHVDHVVDFLYFYVNRRGATEIGFPAFNVADTAICTGVGLLFLLSWSQDRQRSALPEEPKAGSSADGK